MMDGRDTINLPNACDRDLDTGEDAYSPAEIGNQPFPRRISTFDGKAAARGSHVTELVG